MANKYGYGWRYRRLLRLFLSSELRSFGSCYSNYLPTSEPLFPFFLCVHVGSVDVGAWLSVCVCAGGGVVAGSVIMQGEERRGESP